MLKHIVLLQYKTDVSEQQIALVEQAFSALVNDMEDVLDITMGPNNSPEGLTHGFTHAYVLSFADVHARDRYLPHPRHKAFQQIADPLLEKVLVFDF
mgnify:CR=1 FL=1